MNKKAFEIRTLFIGVVMVMFIIALYFLLMTGAGRDLLIKAGIIIPTLNSSTTIKIDSEIIRFDISQDKVQWYDSVNFWDFDKTGQASFNKKTLQESQIKNDFKNYYYDYHARKESVLDISPRIMQKLYAPCTDPVCQQLPILKKGCILFTNLNSEASMLTHDIIINLIEDNPQICPPGEPVGGIISLRANNNVEFLKVTEIKELNGRKQYIMGGKSEIVKDTQLENEIRNKINTWRTSILSKPIKISYVENNAPTSNYFCASFYNPSYLKVDLSLPVHQDTVCPIKII